MRAVLAIILGGALIGCARYEFEITRPPELKRHISQNTDTVVDLPPLEYRLRAYEGRLVLQTFNRTDDVIEFLGAQSVVVDPAGESLSLRSQSIAPRSFMKLIFPPLRDVIYPTGPAIQWEMSYVAPAGSEPVFMLQDIGVPLWKWDGQTEIRVILVYQRVKELIRHEFTFRRVKM